MASDVEPRIVFVVGTGRCGSSLVHEMVAPHRDFAFVSNIDDNLPFLNLKGRFNNPLFRSPLGRLTRKGRLRFAPSEAYRLVARHVSPIYADSHRNLVASDVTPELRERFRTFFLERIRAQARPALVHKYTGWSRIGFFREIFPEARFVHVVRDGRAVANSFLQMGWWTGYLGPGKWNLRPLTPEEERFWRSKKESFVVLAGLAWKILIQSIESDLKMIPETDTLTFRYEDYLLEPEYFCREILNLAGTEIDAAYERRIQRVKIKPGRAQAFRKDLTSEQVEDLEELLATDLQRFGYLD